MFLLNTFRPLFLLVMTIVSTVITPHESFQDFQRDSSLLSFKTFVSLNSRLFSSVGLLYSQQEISQFLNSLSAEKKYGGALEYFKEVERHIVEPLNDSNRIVTRADFMIYLDYLNEYFVLKGRNQILWFAISENYHDYSDIPGDSPLNSSAIGLSIADLIYWNKSGLLIATQPVLVSQAAKTYEKIAYRNTIYWQMENDSAALIRRWSTQEAQFLLQWHEDTFGKGRPLSELNLSFSEMPKAILFLLDCIVSPDLYQGCSF